MRELTVNEVGSVSGGMSTADAVFYGAAMVIAGSADDYTTGYVAGFMKGFWEKA